MATTENITLTGTPAAGYVGVAYSFQPTPAGGDNTKYAYTATGLPAGLAIDANSGKISGTPTGAQESAVTVTLTDGTATITQGFIIAINPAVAISGTPVSARVNTSYQFSPTITNIATGHSATVTLASGTLPTGLSLNANTGTISGTPTAVGSQAVTLKVTDGVTSSTLKVTIAVVTPFAIVPGLTNAILDQTYSYTLATTGSTGAVTWAVEEGTFPEGIAFDTTSGIISGKAYIPGVYPITISAKDPSGASDVVEFDFEVNDESVAEGEGQTAQGIYLSYELQNYLSALSGTGNLSQTQIMTAGKALDAATQLIIHTLTDELLNNALAIVKANPSKFNAAMLSQITSLLQPARAFMVKAMWSQFYNVEITPEIPVDVSLIVRGTRRVGLVAFLNKTRQAALAA